MIKNLFRFLSAFMWYGCIAVLGLSLTACGGGSSSNNNNSAIDDNSLVDDSTQETILPSAETLIQVPASAPAERGALVSVKHLKRNTQAAINTVIADQPDDLPPISVFYDVETFQLNYLTVDGHGVLTEASALIALPQKSPLKRSPILSFQHGTVFYNAEAPTSIFDESAPEVVTASLGYIVLSADYIGYGASLGKEHPYLLAHPSANAVIDLLKAAKTWFDFHDYPYQPQLFLTGYSEGGYVTMATHKIMQEDQIAPFNMVASVVGAGPYDLSITLETLFQGVSEVPSLIADPLTGLLVNALTPDDSDVVFQTTFLERYFNGETQDNVHDWQPHVPVRLYHGKDDKTVPYESSSSALAAMQARQTADVSLVDCPATPSDHVECVVPYWLYMLEFFAPMAEGL